MPAFTPFSSNMFQLDINIIPYSVFILNKDMVCFDWNKKAANLMKKMHTAELLGVDAKDKKLGQKSFYWSALLPQELQEEFNSFWQKNLLSNVEMLLKTPSQNIKISPSLNFEVYFFAYDQNNFVLICKDLTKTDVFADKAIDLIGADADLIYTYELTLARIEEIDPKLDFWRSGSAKSLELNLNELTAYIHPNDAVTAIFNIFKRANIQGLNYFRYRVFHAKLGWVQIEDSPIDFSYIDGIGTCKALGLIRQVQNSGARVSIFQEQSLLAEVLEYASDGIADWDIATGEVTYSKHYLAMLGFEHIAAELRDNSWQLFVHPDDQKLVQEYRTKCILGFNSLETIELRLRDANKTWVWVSHRGKVLARNKNGTALRFFATIININDSKNYQRMLSLLYKIASAGDAATTIEALYASIYEALPVESGFGFAIAVLDDEGQIHIPCSSDEDLMKGGHQCSGCLFKELIATVVHDKSQVAWNSAEASEAVVCHVKWYSWLGTPLMQGERCLGALVMYGRSKDHSFSGTQPQLMSMLANQIAIAIERKKNELNLSILALKDPLTKLANRASLQEQAHHGIERMRRSPDYLCALLMLDLDHFKSVNDQYGHGVGDELLKYVANFLQKQVRGLDTVCRLGGDEFIIFLENTSSPSEAMHVSERILHGLKKPIMIGDIELHIGTSIGVITDLRPYDSLEEMLFDVDTALYQSKRLGRGRYEIFDPNNHRKITKLVHNDQEVINALKNKELSLKYEPIYGLNNKEIIGLEAAVVWNHPELGEISPEQFMVQFIQGEKLHEFTEWMLAESLAIADLWNTQLGKISCKQPSNKQKQKKAEKSIRVGLNIFKKQTCCVPLLNEIDKILTKNPRSMTHFCIEITEAMLHDEDPTLIEQITKMRGYGIKICIESFSSNVNPFFKLKMLPVDCIKFNCKNMMFTPEEISAFKVNIVLLKNLKFSLILAGVSSEKSLRFAQDCGFNFVQGTFFTSTFSTKTLSPCPVQLSCGNANIALNSNNLTKF